MGANTTQFSDKHPSKQHNRTADPSVIEEELVRTGNTPAGIPLSLAPFFQEYDLEQLEPVAHSRLIMERTLAHGNRREVRWLFDRYGISALREWVRTAGSCRLPWRRYNLWCVLMELPPAQRAERRALWPY